MTVARDVPPRYTSPGDVVLDPFGEVSPMGVRAIGSSRRYACCFMDCNLASTEGKRVADELHREFHVQWAAGYFRDPRARRLKGAGEELPLAVRKLLALIAPCGMHTQQLSCF